MERVHLHFDTQRVDEVPTFFKSVILMSQNNFIDLAKQRLEGLNLFSHFRTQQYRY